VTLPPPLKALWEGWKKFAHAFGAFQTKLLLTVFYYVAALPFGLLVRLFMDPLAIAPRRSGTGWVERGTRDKSIDDLRKQS
jgi:hypothetical protein